MSVNVVAARRDGLPYRVSASHIAWFGRKAHLSDGCNGAFGSTAANELVYHLAQKYRLSKTKLLFIVVISHKKFYISAQIFSIGSYGTIYPLYSIGKT